MEPQVLQQIRKSLLSVLADRFRGVVLYGSEARGKAMADSDIDILVLLDGPVDIGSDLRLIIRALYPLQLKIGRPIHSTPVDVQAYQAGQFALYRNAKSEGIQI
ncbi:MAG: nucleotidyltransferase domain-containing protein [Deltaproteobacteria bacterium]|nr:nucleotidyltransferase domain-containing protein [Deltaproteobacteria bacterium]